MAVIVAGALNWEHRPETGFDLLYGAQPDQVSATRQGNGLVKITYENIPGDAGLSPVVVLSGIIEAPVPFVSDIGHGYCLVGGAQNFHFMFTLG